MQKQRTDRAYRLLFAFLFLTSTGVATAQEESELETEKLNGIGIFTGFITNFEADSTGPSAGMDYTRDLSPRIGVGVIAEFATAGEREALFAASLVVRLGEALKLVAAPGLVLEQEQELESSSEEHSSRQFRFVVRIGAGYGFEVSDNVELIPILYLDLIDGKEGSVDVHLVYGVTIDLNF